MTNILNYLTGRHKVIGETKGNREQTIPEVERTLAAVGLNLERFANDPQNPLPVRLEFPDSVYHFQHFERTNLMLVNEKPYSFSGEFHQSPRDSVCPDQVTRFSYRLDK